MARRIVTGEVAGRTTVIIDGESPVAGWTEQIWSTDPSDPLGADPGSEPRPMEPPEFGAEFRLVSLPPQDVLVAMRRAAAGDGSAIDEDGFHETRTIDYLMVLDGELELVMGDGGVTIVRAGDVVVQRGTYHAWRNMGDTPARIITVMVGLPARHDAEGDRHAQV